MRLASQLGTVIMMGSIAVGGCSADDGAPVRVDEEIRGGQVAPDSNGVGLLWLLDGGTCSGTLVTPDVVLTAGHCITSHVGGFLTGVGGPLPEGADPRDNGMTLYRVNDYVRYDDGSRTFLPDVAVVHLATPVPAGDMTPIPRSRTRVPNGTTCTTVGYGRDDAGVAGARRQATVTVTDFTAIAYVASGIDGQIDLGDSGGGLFCNGELVAATWARSANAVWPENKRAAFARIDVVQLWIDGKIASWSNVTRWPPSNPLPTGER